MKSTPTSLTRTAIAFVATVASLGIVVSPGRVVAQEGGGDPFGDVREPPPPVIEDEPNTVVTQSPGGVIGVHGSGFEGSATFGSSGGGAAASCNGVRYGDNPGTPEVEGAENRIDVVSTRRVSREKNVPAEVLSEIIRDIGDFIDAFFGPGPLPTFGVDGPPLAARERRFAVYCDRTTPSAAYPAGNYLGDVVVGPDDAFLNPRVRLPSLYDDLHLVRPVIGRFPQVDYWGGHVVRMPSWLSIEREAWRTQVSTPVQQWRGWELMLIADPSDLSFDIDFEPRQGTDGEAWSGSILCVVDGVAPTNGSSSVFPRVPPSFAEFAVPTGQPGGTNDSCTWTPSGPGTVTITAQIEYDITLWASGAIEPQAPYSWTSEPVTYEVGELRVVNVLE